MSDVKHTPLSPTMQSALNYAAAHGGALVRLPGGFWCEPSATQWSHGIASFGTKTVEGLVTRGSMTYTEWRDGRNGRFPVRAAIASTTAPGSMDGGA